MPEQETLRTPEVSEKPSHRLIAHVAHGHFAETDLPIEQPTGIHKNSLDALRKQNTAIRKVDAQKFAEKKRAENKNIDDATIRQNQFAEWGSGALKSAKDLIQAKQNEASTVFLKLGIPTDIDTAASSFYDPAAQEPGEFYKKYCGTDMYQALARDLTVNDIMILKPLLVKWMVGTDEAFNALLALRAAQDAVKAQAQLTPQPQLGETEKRTLAFYKNGHDKTEDELFELHGGKKLAESKEKPPTASTSTESTTLSSIERTKKEVFHNEASTNSEKHIQLIQDMIGVLKEEKDKGKGKLKDTIQETASSTDGQKVIRDGYVAYIPSKPGERIITIGDIHGDLATIEQILDREEFFEDMESDNPKLRLVFLGDLVDRGPKSVEVMTAIMQLKTRYKDRVHMIAADHDTTSSGVSSHDFPTKLQAPFGQRASEIYQQYNDVFGNMPKMVVTGNGVVMVHGGPVAKPLNLAQIGRLEDTDIDGTAAEQFSWSDPLSIEISTSTDTKDSYLRQWQGAVKHAENEGITNDNQEIELYVDGPKRTLGEIKRAIALIQEMPQGFKPNPDRITGSDYPIFDTLLMGLLEYDLHGFENFLNRIGASVMLRGHQTSRDVDGGQPNLYGDRLWTIHSTGTGSKESAYTGREANPKYGVIDLGESLTTLDSARNIKSVWAPKEPRTTQSKQEIRPPESLEASAPVDNFTNPQQAQRSTMESANTSLQESIMDLFPNNPELQAAFTKYGIGTKIPNVLPQTTNESHFTIAGYGMAPSIRGGFFPVAILQIPGTTGVITIALDKLEEELSKMEFTPPTGPHFPDLPKELRDAVSLYAPATQTNFARFPQEPNGDIPYQKFVVIGYVFFDDSKEPKALINLEDYVQKDVNKPPEKVNLAGQRLLSLSELDERIRAYGIVTES